MRTIKFRQRNKNNGQWHYWGCIRDGEFTGPMTSDNYVRPEESDESTGLHDKNGKEIYEGDICKTWRGVGQVTFGLGGEGEPADYVGGYLGWCVGEDKWETNGFTNSAQIEIIGNIYENPELLNTSN